MEHSCIFVMHTNAVLNSFVLSLYLWLNFCNIAMKIKYKLQVATGSAAYSPQLKNSGCAAG